MSLVLDSFSPVIVPKSIHDFRPSRIIDLSDILNTPDLTTCFLGAIEESLSDVGGSVSKWSDLSVNGYDLTKSNTSYMPLIDNINGVTALKFNGSTSSLDNFTNANDIYAGAMTMIVVAERYSNTHGDVFTYFSNQTVEDGGTNFNGYGGGANPEVHLGCSSTGNYIQYYDTASDVRYVDINELSSDASLIKTIAIRYTPGGYVTLNTNAGETFVSTTTAKNPQSTANLFRIGAVGDLGIGRGLYGKIGAVVIIKRECTNAEVNTIGKKLADIYKMGWVNV